MPLPGALQEALVDKTDGSGFYWLKRQNCDAITAAIHRLPDLVSLRGHLKSNQRYVGSVPNLLAISWAKEWGVRLYSREWLERAQKRIKHDPNFVKLRLRL